jgi:hypothetical protein
MALYTGTYAADTSPIIDRFEPGRRVFVEATIEFNATTSTTTFLNTGGTYLALRIPPYAKLVDVSMMNMVTCASTGFNADLCLMLFNETAGGTVYRHGSLIINTTAFWTGTITGMRSFRGGAGMFAMNATNAFGLTYTATTLPDILCGASEVFNVSATEKYIALIGPTTATWNTGGTPHNAASTSQLVYVSAEYRMLNNAALLV